jgi:hypothetical protein
MFRVWRFIVRWGSTGSRGKPLRGENAGAVPPKEAMNRRTP